MPEYKLNPSRWGPRITLATVALIPTAIAFYMGLYQWRIIDTVWDPLFGKETLNVLDSTVSVWFREHFFFPDAILGSFGYFTDVIFALLGSSQRWHKDPWLVTLFGLNVIPMSAVSVILVILQGTVVGSWCTLCLVTAFFSLLLIVLSYNEVRATLLLLHSVWKKTKSKKILWQTFCGRN